MAEAVGLNVVKLHRTMFSGITLKGISLGNWIEMEGRDMEIVIDAIAKSKSSEVSNSNSNSGGGSSSGFTYDDDIE